MAAGGEVRVFTRQATGLTKEIGRTDTFVYNVNNQNIGIGVAFILLFVPGFYAGADLFQSMVIAALLAIPMALVYAFFSAAIPRSGGDYVYISRTLHPLLGFVASWNWVAWMTVYIGVPAAYLAQYGLSGLFRMTGVAAGSQGLIELGNAFVNPDVTLVVGTILIVLFAIIFATGTRVYFRLQNTVFVIGIIGILAAIVLAFLASPGAFAGNFDAYVAAAGGIQNASSLAQPAAPYDSLQTIYSSTWPQFIVLFAITSSFLGGEVRQARVSQMLGMPGGVVFVTVFMFILVGAVVNLVGLPLLGAISANYFSPDALGLSFVPAFNEVVAAAFPGNLLVALVLGFTFVFWTYVWLPINFLASTRALLAWSLDGLMPARVSEVNETRHTPTAAIVIVAILGWLSLFLYTRGVINTLYGIFGWILSFVLCSIAAIVFPYRLKAVFDSSPVNWRVAGIPLMSIVGVVATVCLLIVEWIWWADPINGLEHTPDVLTTFVLGPYGMWIVTAGVLITGVLWYLGARAIQASRGVRIERAFAEIPPE
ncbi:MAG TPA: APC family permease [Candidatus Limnocylindrales bacterium]|nr:APC family permease [Candidatus Limnocylindrales bacterium]